MPVCTQLEHQDLKNRKRTNNIMQSRQQLSQVLIVPRKQNLSYKTGTGKRRVQKDGKVNRQGGYCVRQGNRTWGRGSHERGEGGKVRPTTANRWERGRAALQHRRALLLSLLLSKMLSSEVRSSSSSSSLGPLPPSLSYYRPARDAKENCDRERMSVALGQARSTSSQQ